MLIIMGVKKVFKYAVGMAVAGYAGYELARMHCKGPGAREERMQRRERMESMEYTHTPRESSDRRDYRSIYNL
jgi:hypothetical protein